jgi:hypothetical protein
MPAHHTKDKGDLGVAKAFADLVGKGYLVLFPTTEHAPFDLVGYRAGQFTRVQVKYRSMKNGRIELTLKSAWSDRHGTHQRPVDKSEIDLVCLYCPDTDKCYYVLPSAMGQSITLRVSPSLNNQQQRVRFATDFLEVPI